MVNKPVTVICYHFQVLCTIHIVHAILSCDWVCSWFIYTSVTTSTWVMHCPVTLQWLWHHIGNRKFSAPYYNFMGPSSYMQTIVDQSIVKQHVTLLATKQADICIEITIIVKILNVVMPIQFKITEVIKHDARSYFLLC